MTPSPASRPRRRPSALDSDQRAALQRVLSEASGVVLAILYGSAVSGAMGSHSDVDIGVAREDGAMDPDAMDALRRQVERVVERPADIVDLHVAPGTLLHQILSRGQILRNARPSCYAELMIRMLDDQEDFQPSVRMIRRRHAEALAHGT